MLFHFSLGFATPGVSKTLTTPLHPQSNGVVERYIETVEEHPGKVVAYHQTDVSLEKMEACLEKTEAKDVEANPEEIDSEAEHK
jgi:hypothetical protein